MALIETKQLLIDFWEEEMVEDFFDLTEDHGFTLFPITVYKQKNLESALEWIRQMRDLNLSTSLGKYAVRDKEKKGLIGMGGLTPWSYDGEELIDITYRLRESAWGKGLGLELASRLCHFGLKELHLSQLSATITPDNIASKKIAEKIGLKLDKRILLLGVETELYRLEAASLKET